MSQPGLGAAPSPNNRLVGWLGPTVSQSAWGIVRAGATQCTVSRGRLPGSGLTQARRALHSRPSCKAPLLNSLLLMFQLLSQKPGRFFQFHTSGLCLE